jgi:cystathionine beta-lyase/cystathionine gamma-synthase
MTGPFAEENRSLFESKFCVEEGSRHCLSFNSAIQAYSAILRGVVHSDTKVVAGVRCGHEFVHACELNGVSNITFVKTAYDLLAETKNEAAVIVVESPNDPPTDDFDIRTLAKLCRSYDTILIVDNTLLGPTCQRPLECGASVTVYSSLGLINGHDQVMGAVLGTDREDLYEILERIRNTDATLSPLDSFSSWMALRGIETLRERQVRHALLATKTISSLQQEYPGLKVFYASTNQNARHNHVSCGGGVFAIKLPSSELASRFVDCLKTMQIGNETGNMAGCYATLNFPRRGPGMAVNEGIVRFSVGLVDWQSVFDDICSALNISGAFEIE